MVCAIFFIQAQLPIIFTMLLWALKTFGDILALHEKPDENVDVLYMDWVGMV